MAVGSRSGTCNFCKLEVPDDWTYCPHCGQPQRLPNVVVAERLEEQETLERRYQEPLIAADARGCRTNVDSFGVATNTSKAVMCCPATKLLPMVTGHVQLYATYYELEELRTDRSARPGSCDWRTVRPKAEIDLLGSDRNKEQLHYACL